MTDVERAAFAAALSQCDVATVDFCPAGTLASPFTVVCRALDTYDAAERRT
jgi:hypothetical protein